MARTLSDTQKKFLRIYDNLRFDADNFTPTAAESENFGRVLLDDFMQEETFTDAIRSIATDFGRMDILKHVDNYTPVAGERFGAAVGLVAAVERADDAMLVDLIKDPKAPTYSFSELNKFWNIAANIQKNDPELYTHLVADNRYMAIFDQTVAANEYEADGVQKLRKDVLAAHEGAANTLGAIQYDKFQAMYTGMSNDIYSLLENSDFETIGKKLTADAPKTIFTGLEIKKPLDGMQLTEVFVPIHEYHEDIQDVKIAAAEKIDATPVTITPIENLPLPELAGHPKFDTVTTATVAPSSANPIESLHLQGLTGDFNFKANEATKAPEKPVAAAPEQKMEEYTVQKGENLWNIARNEYGLKSYKDIMRAVDHIAQANGLEKGVDANNIGIGDKLKMPTADEIKNPLQKLDWVALDADVVRKSTLAHTM